MWAQQRLEFDEVVDRVRFGEDLGSTAAWGFDHFGPKYVACPAGPVRGCRSTAGSVRRRGRRPDPDRFGISGPR